jgi:hypothetical protein
MLATQPLVDAAMSDEEIGRRLRGAGIEVHELNPHRKGSRGVTETEIRTTMPW